MGYYPEQARLCIAMTTVDIWIRRGLKVLLTMLVFMTAAFILFQGAIKLTKAAYYNGRLDPPPQTVDKA